jgi:ribosomal protein S18 acetylase RimI-like enzyme
MQTKVEIKPAIEFGENVREKISELYVDGFFDVALKHFSKDKAKIKEAFLPMFPIEYFYLAIIDSEIVGMAACLGKGNICLNLDKKRFTKYFGKFMGFMAYLTNKQYIKNLPVHKMDNESAVIEYVITDSKYKGMGVASTIIKHIFDLPEYKHFLIEVADTNPGAFELYKKLGFKETHRKKFMPGSGINYWIHMRYSKE